MSTVRLADRLEIAGSAIGIMHFLHDGEAPVAEYAADTGTMLMRDAHGTGAGDEPLVCYEGGSMAAGTQRYLHAGECGSIIAGHRCQWQRHQFQPLRRSRRRTRRGQHGIPAAANAGRFKSTGQAWLPELGMHCHKARMYSPSLGRFMQTDPIEYEDQFNLDTYVGNDPVNAVDPTGMQSCKEDEACPDIALIDETGSSSGCLKRGELFACLSLSRSMSG